MGTATALRFATPPAALAVGPSFVGRDGALLTVAGRRFHFTGINVYNAASDGTCWYSYTEEELRQALDDIGLAGRGVIRAWFFQSLATTGGVRDWSRLDRLLSVAADQGYRVIATLGNQWADCEPAAGYKDQSWYQGGYLLPDPGGPRDGLGNPTTSYYDWAAEVAGRYQGDPTILAWQLLNEPEVKTSESGGCAAGGPFLLRDWAADVSARIKAVDPNHLVSIGTTGGPQCGQERDWYELVHDVATVDLCEFHDYKPGEALPTFTYGDGYDNGLLSRLRICQGLAKPLIVGEIGIQPPAAGGTFEGRALRLDEKLYAQFGAGIAGALAWAWDREGSDPAGYDIGPADPVLDVLDRWSAVTPRPVARVSVGDGEQQATGTSLFPAVSDDGRWVLFQSNAPNLIDPSQTTGDGQFRVFLRDVWMGRTVLVDDSDGDRADMTPDGQSIVYAKHVGTGETQVRHVFLREEMGPPVMLTVNAAGAPAQFGGYEPTISDDGRYVAFLSRSADLVPGTTDDGIPDLYVLDRAATPPTPQVTLITAGSSGHGASGETLHAAINGNGRFVWYVSAAGDLVAGDTNDGWDSFVTEIGGPTERVSVASDGSQTFDPNPPATASPGYLGGVSDDGRRVVFTSEASGLVSDDGNGRRGVFLRTRDPLQPSTVRLSATPSGFDTGSSDGARITPDGRYVIFDSENHQLVPGDGNGVRDVFLVDLDAPGRPVELISTSANGQEGNGLSTHPTVGRNARYVAFASLSTNLVTGADTNGAIDIFLRDLEFLDEQPPTVIGIPDRAPNVNGWYNANVLIDWVATDPEPSSGPPTDPSDILASTEGEAVTYTSDESCDPFGNCATGTIALSIDRTAPTVDAPTFDPPAKPEPGSTVIRASAADALSGIAAGEYWVDTDPGVGLASPMAWDGSQLLASIGSGLSVGDHLVGVRSRDRADIWSTTATVTLRVTGIATGRPCSVRQDATEDADRLRFFAEQGYADARLCAPIGVDITKGGRVYGGANVRLTPGTVPAGSTVTSFLVHVDPVTVDASGSRTLSGTINFTKPITGVAAVGSTLRASDALAASGTRYPQSGGGFDFASGSKDRIGLSSDKTQLVLAAHVLATGFDELRVIAPAGTTIAAVSGSVQRVPAPCDLERDAFESDSRIALIDEQAVTELAACGPVAVNITEPGTYTWDAKPALGAAFTPTGPTRSFLLHADQPGPFDAVTPPPQRLYAATLTFDEEILAIVVGHGELDETDYFGPSGTLYPPASDVSREVEFWSPETMPERLTLSADRHRLDVVLQVGRFMDQVRIITAAP